jgi:sugar diacid utilization regulator
LGMEQIERDCGDAAPPRSFGAGPFVVDLRVPVRLSASRCDEIESVLQLAVRPEGLSQVTAWIAQRAGGCAVVFDHDLRPLIVSPMVPADLLPRIAGDLRRVARGEVSAEAVELGDWSARILPLAGSESGVLLVASRSSVSREVHSLARDAASLISLCLRVERSNQSQHRLEVAYDHNREAVIHLLMAGQVAWARTVAGALQPELHDTVRVYVVECTGQTRRAVASRCEEATDGKAWIVRCPVYYRHLCVIAPAVDPTTLVDSVEKSLHDLAASSGSFYVGASNAGGLRDVPSCYSQAIHALAVARNSRERFARFRPHGTLAATIGPIGRSWAIQVLKPLLDYVPDRPQDPDALELLATLTSWLSFYSGAARQLKVHRNTLAGRLRLLSTILGPDLRRLESQAVIHLALQLLEHPLRRTAETAETLDEPIPTLETLLAHESVQQWAELRLSPLCDPVLLETLRVWLHHDARLDTTAAALQISLGGTRKRLQRAEQLLQLSLLTGPSARYEMLHAMRVRDLENNADDPSRARTIPA